MNPKRVLIIEDEAPLSHALSLKLTHEGFEVTVANNGREGLDAIAENSFDVVLLDLVMPEVDGFQVLQELNNRPDHPAVFVLSNLSQHEDEVKATSLGARKFFIKSNTPLTTIVEEVKKV